jgi:hypothetical protein
MELKTPCRFTWLCTCYTWLGRGGRGRMVQGGCRGQLSVLRQLSWTERSATVSRLLWLVEFVQLIPLEWTLNDVRPFWDEPVQWQRQFYVKIKSRIGQLLNVSSYFNTTSDVLYCGPTYCRSTFVEGTLGKTASHVERFRYAVHN